MTEQTLNKDWNSHPVQTLILEKKRRTDRNYVVILRIYEDGEHKFYRVPKMYWQKAGEILK